MKNKQILVPVSILLGMAFLVGCSVAGSSLTPTPEPSATPTLPALVNEPTNPAGFDFPFNLTNITLACPSAGNYVLEFDYLPVNTIIDSVGDPNNSATNLTCAFRTTGHGVCSGTIDFGTLGVVSLQVCQGRSSLTRICISQAVHPAQCPATP